MIKKKNNLAHLVKADQWSGKEIELLLFGQDQMNTAMVTKLQREKKEFLELLNGANFRIKNALIHTEGKIDGSIDKIKFLKWYKKIGYPVRPELERVLNGDDSVVELWLWRLQSDFLYYVQTKY